MREEDWMLVAEVRWFVVLIEPALIMTYYVASFEMWSVGGCSSSIPGSPLSQ